MNICEFCKKNFQTVSSLNLHKKSAKYCLKIQNSLQNKNYICKFCDCNLKSKQALEYHENICRSKNNNIILELEEKIEDIQKENNIKIKDLEDKIKKLETNLLEKDLHITRIETLLEVYQEDHSELKNINKNNSNAILDIAKQPKTTNNNIINNLAIYDINKITEKFVSNLDSITKEDIINGQRGIADKILPYLYDENGKKMVTCTDRARLVFTKIDAYNNKSKDIELKELASVIKPFAIKRADEIVNRQNEIREKTYNIETLKKQIKDYHNYIDQYYKQIENSSSKKCSQEYLKKIEELENAIIDLNMKLEILEIDKKDEVTDLEINENNKNTLVLEILENDTERLLDGHTEIKQLDIDSTKFARQVSKNL
jgi:hypothetical protein